MNFSEGTISRYLLLNLLFIVIILEYEGYDDVYGHSVEDDYCISPSDAAFMYDRESSRNQRGIGVFLQTEKNIVEEDEEEVTEVQIKLLV